VFIQVLLGALVAGLKAGLAYNTWPDMNGALLPPGLGELSPWHLNLFDNVTMVQFNHRLVAYGVAAMALWHAFSMWRRHAAPPRRSALLVAGAVLAQVGLGIWTLLAGVPLPLGLAHQAGAALVFMLLVSHVHLLARAEKGRP
jgi:cytochrome c oxidase assembly protein subunit 15